MKVKPRPPDTELSGLIRRGGISDEAKYFFRIELIPAQIILISR